MFYLQKIIAMKKVFLFALIIGVTLFSCKTTKKTAKSAYEPATTQTNTTTKIFTVPKTTATSAKTSGTTSEKPITTRKEAITFTQPEDQNQNSFFIIIGSFSNLDNAKKFQQTLIGEGFKPIIVQSETGFYRVTVDSFNEETPARSRLLQIRQDFPKYADTWLLVKK